MKHISRLWAFILAALVISSLVAAGCGNDGGTTDVSTPEQKLRAVLRAAPSTLDPALVEDVDAQQVVQQIFAGLTKISGEDLEVLPDLAEGLGKVSEDGTVITYTLREGLTWTNGEPITAQDFIDSWLRALNPETGGPLNYLLFDISGAAAYANCEGDECAELRNAVGVEAIDERTIQIDLERAVPYFDQIFANTVAFAVPTATAEQHGNNWTDPENIVSSGAFVYAANEGERSFTLERNQEYWDAEDVGLESVVLEVVGDQNAAYRQFRDEEFDVGFVGALPGTENVDEAKTMPEFQTAPELATIVAYMNTTSPRLENNRVRQAIAIAINRTKIVERITKAGEVPTATVAPPGIAGYDIIEQGSQDFIQPDADPDLDRARQLLAEAGWDEDTELTLYFTNDGSQTAQPVAESIQDDLAQVGISVKLMLQTDQDALYDVATPPVDDGVDIMLIGWIADYSDANSFYSQFQCDNEFNASNYCNEAYDEVVNEAAGELDDAARFEKQKEAEAMLTGPEGDFPAATLYRASRTTMVQPWVEGFAFTPLGGVDLTTVGIVDKG